MGEIVNLRRARKAKGRAEAAKQAEANRIAHGRAKAEKRIAKTEADKARAHHDGHKITRAPETPDE
jgi:hypothetical protein